MSETTWIAVDWGTSNLRVWVFGHDDQILAQHQSAQGMGQLNPDQFEPALLDLIAPYLSEDKVVTVLCCGMVGAAQGWSEATYNQAPCTPPSVREAKTVPSKDPRICVYILPGVCQKSPADVMRGEETQIAGFIAQNPDFFGILCLPGTHTKWVQISAKEIVSFRTFMSGEIFALLSQHSVLRHSVDTQDWSDADYLEAVNDALSSPQQLGARLFGLRAQGLLDGLGASAARARLSGYLIGLELAGARSYWLGQDLALIGTPAMTKLYESALAAQGATPSCVDGDAMTLAGLRAAYSAMNGESA